MIHRYWHGPNEPTVEGHVWHDEDFPQEIVCWLDAREDLVQPSDPRHRSNMVRWWLLACHGGLWLDHDATLIGKVPDGDFVSVVGGRVDAGVVRLSSGHPLAWAMLSYLDDCTAPPRWVAQVSGSRRLQGFSRSMGVAEQPLDGWCDHQFVTSRGYAS